MIPKASVEICILAGGLSARMGRDKGSLQIGRRTMLGWVRASARATGLKVRVIRRDLVARCGPLGGVFTALKTTKATSVLFLPCDMPFVTRELLDRVLNRPRRAGSSGAVFVKSGPRIGFPFLLPKSALEKVLMQIEAGDPSIQSLFTATKAKVLSIPAKLRYQLENINTPKELQLARQRAMQPPT